MTRKSKDNSKRTRQASDDSVSKSGGVFKERTLRIICWAILIGATFVASAAAGSVITETVAPQKAQETTPYSVDFSHRPAWITEDVMLKIRRKIAQANVPFNSPDLCDKIYELAISDPWIKDVSKVTRHDAQIVRYLPRRGATVRKRLRPITRYEGRVVINAQFRKPVARVWVNNASVEGHFFVDAQGVRLPNDEVPYWQARDGHRKYYYLKNQRTFVPRNLRERKIYYISIEGVSKALPEVGKPWNSPALLDGIKLTRLILRQPFASQVSAVDVSNHKKRITRTEPDLYFVTKRAGGRYTRVLFGRFPRNKGADHVIKPDRKMKNLRKFVQYHGGQLAGIREWIDISCGWISASPQQSDSSQE